jgi:hypothetical protein
VLAAETETQGPFAVANGDDLYSRSSLLLVREFLARAVTEPIPTYGVVGYQLIDTLSKAGAVSRAVCRCDPNDGLLDIAEIHGIERHEQDGLYSNPEGVSQLINGKSLVSMNLWAFYPTIHEQLRAQFERHRRRGNKGTDEEFGLPTAIRGLVQEGSARVTVLRGGAGWCGLTHRQDRLQLTRHIESRIEAGEYPRRLWG